ncbi:MAG TPA: hypothetical protein VFQ76_07845, partial [Longimicrobiaceae bacterium]|nr:hypothetical protein [Longimicrobiaceae bacterium]
MITLSMAAEIATCVAGLVAVFGIPFGILIYRRQMNAQLFITFTQRYEEIMSNFPDDGYKTRFCLVGELPPPSAALTTSVLRYLNLCSEEFYLWKNRLIDGKLWRIWQTELERAIRSPLIVREWPELRSEFESYPAFQEYVERIQRTQ